MTQTEIPIAADLSQAVRRWKVGHHVFHLQIITLTSLIQQILDEMEQGAWGAIPGELRRVADLYDSATASMKFAADFRPEAYESLIRPSMGEPLLSPGFSGTLNQDHTQMLERLHHLKRTLRSLRAQGTLPAEAADAMQHLWKAQSKNRRHHMLVCERFVPGGESQLKQFLNQRENQQENHTEGATNRDHSD